MGIAALLPLAEAVWGLACLLAMTATARFALGAGPVDGERVFAALAVYLLAGLVFSVGYWSLDRAWPNSFAVDLDLPRRSISAS
jgi:hypothetical protein